MTEILIAIPAFVVAIGLLVAIHEFGHFWVAKKLGIKVLRFSIGFGKPIWRRQSDPDDTEYVIASIPLGGYVKMLDERDGPVAESERHMAFNRAPIRNRMAVLVAGPVFNFIFAIFAYWMMFMLGVPGLTPIVGEIAEDSYAAKAGLREQDQIVAVAGRPTATWETTVISLLGEMLDDSRIPLRVVGLDGLERDLTIDIGGDIGKLTEPGQLFRGLGISGWSPTLEPRLGQLTAGGPAEKAGLLRMDLVLSADGQDIGDWQAWVEFVRARPGQRSDVMVQRGGRRILVALDIGSVEEDGESVGRIGAAVHYPDELRERVRSEQRYAPVAAFGQSLRKSWEMSALTLRMFWRMLSGDVSMKNISGPINIAQYAGYTASIGLVPFLSFLAIVSISLGLLNLFPIPMLDGGQLVYQFVELVKGSPVSERTELIGQQLGIAMLLVLMSFAFYNDIARLVG